MKPVLRSSIVTAALVLGTNLLLATSNDYIEQWHKAKLGRVAPMEEAGINAERANTAYREEARYPSANSADIWHEYFFKAKSGRSSPMEEARLKALGEGTVYREEAAPKPSADANSWQEDFLRAKLGRTPPR
jgi:hypothetical protein